MQLWLEGAGHGLVVFCFSLNTTGSLILGLESFPNRGVNVLVGFMCPKIYMCMHLINVSV